MKTQKKALAFAAALVISLANIAALAQQTLDRNVVPPAGPTPVLRVPPWTKQQLANGATLIVSDVGEQVSFNARFEPMVQRYTVARQGRAGGR